MSAPPTAGCPEIVFTLNGKPTGTTRTAPCAANDFAVTWKPGKCYVGTELPAVSVVFTFQGGYVSGDPPLARCLGRRAVTGVEIFWTPTGNTNQITRACWMISGTCVAGMPVPNGGLVSSNPGGQTTAPLINDACYELSYGNGGIKKAYWTRNGSVYSTISVPPKANDVCWYGYGAS
jgi:hypothetical protein